MECIAWIVWVKVDKTFEVFGDVSWHVNVDIFLVVIPFNCQSTVVLPFKVHGYLVIFLRAVQEMISIGIGKLFDTKIFNARAVFSSLHVSRSL